MTNDQLLRQILYRVDELAKLQLFTAQIAIRLRKQGVDIMATLDQVLQSVNDETTLDDSIIALLNGIEQQLKDALAGVTLPPESQAKVNAIFDAAEANKAKVAAAIAANTVVP